MWVGGAVCELVAINLGSWPVLVKRSCLELSPRVPAHRKGGKTAPLLRESSSMPLVEVPVLSTSPNVAKSQQVVAMFDPPTPSVDKARGKRIALLNRGPNLRAA